MPALFLTNRVIISVTLFLGQHVNKKLRRTRLSKIMATDIHPISPDDSLATLVKCFLKESIPSLPVVDTKGMFLGEVRRVDILKTCVDLHDISLAVISEYDSKIDRGYNAQTARDLMVARERTFHGTATIEDALLVMLKEDDNVIPILDARGRFKGIITDDLLLRNVYR